MRRSLLATAALSALFLSVGAVVAHADPSLLVTASEAKRGDTVQFSITGTEEDATYKLEIGDAVVAEGSDPTGNGVSRGFIMPNLGETSRAVTVEAQITQSDETTTLTRSLQYVVPTQPAGGSTEPQPAPSAAHAPAAQAAPKNETAQRSVAREPVQRRIAPTRRLRRSPPRAPQRSRGRPTGGNPSARGSGQSRGRAAHATTRRKSGSSSVTASAAGDRELTPTSSSDTRPASGRGGPVELGKNATLPTALTAPPRAPGLFSLTSGIIPSEGSGPPIAAAAAMPALLALAALALVGFRPVRRWGPARVEPGEAVGPDQIGRKYLYVPGPAGLAGPIPSESAEGDPLAPGKRWPAPALTAPEDREAPLLLDDAGIEAIASFAPISLAALDQRAGLATRSESKYILDPKTFERLLGELAPHYQVLDIDGARVFLYDTIYFDTPTQTIYRHHVQGRRRRFKCRTRLYSASGPCFFEVKLKGGRGETIKRRFEVDIEEHGLFTPRAHAFLEGELGRAYGVSCPAALAPVLRTNYRRLTLVSRVDSERLTFDLELMFAVNGKDYSIQPGRILLETKAGTGPAVGGNGLLDANGRAWQADGRGTEGSQGAAEADGGRGEANEGALDAGKTLRRLGARPVQSCSKYCIGVALAHPELRNNPFRRLIRLHFESDRHPRRRAYDRPR